MSLHYSIYRLASLVWQSKAFVIKSYSLPTPSTWSCMIRDKGDFLMRLSPKIMKSLACECLWWTLISSCRITYCHLPFQSKWLYIGSERGNIHIVNVESFTLSGYVIMWNKAIELWVCFFHPRFYLLAVCIIFYLVLCQFTHNQVSMKSRQMCLQRQCVQCTERTVALPLQSCDFTVLKIEGGAASFVFVSYLVLKWNKH